MRLNTRIDGTPEAGVDDFTTIQALRRDNTPFDLDAEVDAWIALLQPFYSSSQADFINAELWSYTPESFDADFVAAYDIGVSGSSGTTSVVAGQVICTFRTQEGGIMKLSLMEAVTVAGSPISPPYTGSLLALTNAIVLGTSPWLARDTSYAIANIRTYPGQNEALFKKIFRPKITQILHHV
jgi:hypothetical protein